MSETSPAPAVLLESARRAFELQTRAMSASYENGIEDFLEIIHDDIVWRFPKGKYAGEHRGKASFAEFFRYACAYFPSGLRFELRHVLSDGQATVAFEFRDYGQTPDGQPYQAYVTISYTLHDDKIIGYREYFG